MNTLDQIDRQILDLLQANARRTNAEIAEAVGLAAPSVFERIRKLEQRGVIRGYTVQVDPEALGKTLTAFIRLTAAYDERHAAGVEAIAADPDVLECYSVAGEDCLILKTRVSSPGALEALKNDLVGLRTGRASTALLDPINVEVYGAQMPLNQVATVSVPEPRLLSVQVWDKGNVGPVEKAIRSAGLGLNPITDGTMIRLPIPDLTEERRKELAKLAGQYAEKARIAVRNVRRDGMDHLKVDEKKHEISEDERKRLEVEVQKLTDDTIKEIDNAAHAKEQEILGK